MSSNCTVTLAPPPNSSYFELSWAVLSTIGAVYVLLGLMVSGIVGWSNILLVPIVVSAAGALANGLCFVAYYTEYPAVNRTVAGAIADAAWLVS